MLEKIGRGRFEIQVVEDGARVVEISNQRCPDIVLMDLQMPILSGLDAVKILRTNPAFSDLPVVAVTADAFSHQKQEAMSLGFTDYLTKPISLTQLHSVLARLLPLGAVESLNHARRV
eukprot:TRINITY_DN5989_c0_g1_i2.p1 TRINITY_DN5989_c0_g1~~TRINITY_DN5989_c0_g1_i2.p1  ORF type:complete len:118 (-),score=20.20 TRINITY_DN5989_c0_g1_i2:657-1010(-)